MPVDRSLRRVRTDGSEIEITPGPLEAFSEAEVSAAAKADPDAQPLTDEEMRLVPRAKTLRRVLGLTRE